MSNWKNVNNWVNKNCISWAKTYFTDNVVGLKVEKDGHEVKIVNWMKSMYSWEGIAQDGTIVAGTINVPEVAHDFDLDEYVFEISVKEEDQLRRMIRDIVKKDLTPLMRKQFSLFTDDLIKSHGSDVYIEADQLGQAAPPRVQ
ncbi:unnamed protein product [Cunninghamella blakesleeana]